MDSIGSTSSSVSEYFLEDLVKSRLVTSNASRNPDTGDWDISLYLSVEPHSPRGKALLSFMRRIDVWMDE